MLGDIRMGRVEARNRSFPILGPLAAGALATLLAGCVSTADNGPAQPAVASSASPPAPSHLSREELVGRWGVASFREEKDRKRTEAEARAQCSQPYVIARGPTDGVMMHAADDPALHELRLKEGADRKVYLGFEAPAGDWQDREILSATKTMLVMRFVDADANTRYGTFVYARCG